MIALANSNSKCWDYIFNHACFGMIVEGSWVQIVSIQFTLARVFRFCFTVPTILCIVQCRWCFVIVHHNLSSKIRDCTELSLSC